MNKDILLCGVGGQGTVLASKLIAAAAMREGHTVHSAETIGMAQRGGSVTSHIRIGEDIGSPLIPFGSADMILAFEPAEAVRNLHYLKPDGIVIVNRTPVRPTTESLNETGYDGVKELEYLKTKKAQLPQWVTGPQPSVYGINGNKLRQKNSKRNKDTGRDKLPL